MPISKVILNGVTQMDVTDTTAEAADVTAPEVFYSSNGTRTVGTGTGGAVLSVNGQTGTVVLTATDVGALPDTTTIPTATSDLTNDSGFVNASGAASAAPVQSVNGQTGTVSLTIPTKTSELTNDSDFMSGMTILAYGKSTWNDFITAYNSRHVVYCRASSSSNPASGAQTRMAFMAYVNNETNPTEVEFQYYRSVSSHSATQQGDQVYVYKLNKTNGWTVTVREAYTRIVAGTGISATYSNGVLTISLA